MELPPGETLLLNSQHQPSVDKQTRTRVVRYMQTEDSAHRQTSRVNSFHRSCRVFRYRVMAKFSSGDHLTATCGLLEEPLFQPQALRAVRGHVGQSPKDPGNLSFKHIAAKSRSNRGSQVLRGRSFYHQPAHQCLHQAVIADGISSSPSASASVAPAAAKPSAGVPQAIASRKAIPKPSPVEGITKRSAMR